MPECDALLALLSPRLDRSTCEWLQGVVDATTAPFDARAFRAEWARVGRRTGSHPVDVTVEEAEHLRAVGPWPLIGWGSDEVGRAALLLRALSVSDRDLHVPLLRALYLRGTIRERQALLRVLAWMPDPGRFADLAAEASRTHVVSVFESIALGNPYPSRWFVRPIFDQMVQKALALRLAPERIVGLADRVAPGPVRARVSTTVRPSPHPALPALLAP